MPVHPTKILQTAPVVYGFAAPMHATYVPYFDPPYFYDGYHRVVRWRYQAIAIVKNLGDLTQALCAQPAFFGVLFAVALLTFSRRSRRLGLRWLRAHRVVFACSLFGVALFVPVHLEGRYIASFLAVLGVCDTKRRCGKTWSITRRLRATRSGWYQNKQWQNGFPRTRK
jgi:hypothetical protein